jgi:hypothetical protein
MVVNAIIFKKKVLLLLILYLHPPHGHYFL